MTMYKALYLCDDIERPYKSRKGGRELASIEYYIDPSVQGLEGYNKKSKERLNTTASNSNKKK